MDKMIRPDSVCRQKNGAFVKDGISEDALLYVIGLKALPYSVDDPYLLRTYMIISEVDRETGRVSEDPMLCDPRDLELVEEELASEIMEKVNELYTRLLEELKALEQEPESVSIN